MQCCRGCFLLLEISKVLWRIFSTVEGNHKYYEDGGNIQSVLVVSPVLLNILNSTHGIQTVMNTLKMAYGIPHSTEDVPLYWTFSRVLSKNPLQTLQRRSEGWVCLKKMWSFDRCVYFMAHTNLTQIEKVNVWMGDLTPHSPQRHFCFSEPLGWIFRIQYLRILTWSKTAKGFNLMKSRIAQTNQALITGERWTYNLSTKVFLIHCIGRQGE